MASTSVRSVTRLLYPFLNSPSTSSTFRRLSPNGISLIHIHHHQQRRWFSKGGENDGRSLNTAELSLKVGQIQEVKKVIGEKEIQLFGELSGDYNPIHFNEEFASKTPFKKRIAHGMVSASLFSSILGNMIPGSIYVSQSIFFRAPVFIGDEVTAKAEVVEIKSTTSRTVGLATTCKNQNGVLLIDGTAVIKVPKGTQLLE